MLITDYLVMSVEYANAKSFQLFLTWCWNRIQFIQSFFIVPYIFVLICSFLKHTYFVVTANTLLILCLCSSLGTNLYISHFLLNVPFSYLPLLTRDYLLLILFALILLATKVAFYIWAKIASICGNGSFWEQWRYLDHTSIWIRASHTH